MTAKRRGGRGLPPRAGHGGRPLRPTLLGGGARPASRRAKPRYTDGRPKTEVPKRVAYKTHGSAERHDQSNEHRCHGSDDMTEPRCSHPRVNHGRACWMQGTGGFTMNERR